MSVTAVQYLPLAKVQVQERGAVTIPADIRGEMAIGAGDTLTVLRVGDSIIMTRKRLQLPEITAEFETIMQEEGVTLEDLLDDLDTQRAAYVREQYGLNAWSLPGCQRTYCWTRFCDGRRPCRPDLGRGGFDPPGCLRRGLRRSRTQSSAAPAPPARSRPLRLSESTALPRGSRPRSPPRPRLPARGGSPPHPGSRHTRPGWRRPARASASSARRCRRRTGPCRSVMGCRS